MITEEQEKWLEHLSDTKKVTILPYDPKVLAIFRAVKKQIQEVLGNKAEVLHKGASAWGISGKGELDVYVPVSEDRFDCTAKQLTELFGDPGSYYPLEWVRWNTEIDGVEVEVFLMNRDHSLWATQTAFWEYMETHPEVMEEYRELKESADGLSTQEYYRKKLEFYNKIEEKLEENTNNILD